MAYDQAAADWQAEADRYRRERDEARAELRGLRVVVAALAAAGVPTTTEHEAEHWRMAEEFRRARPEPTGEYLRVGRQVGRTIYRCTPDDPEGSLVGVMDTPELAAEVVEAANRVRYGPEEGSGG